MLLAQSDASAVGHTLLQVWQTDATGVARQIKALWQADAAGVPHMIYSATTLTLSAPQASGYAATKGSSRVYTEALAIQGYSDTPVVTWAVPEGWSVSSQGATSTSFRSPFLQPGEDISTSGSVAVVSSGVTQTLAFDLYASNQGI